MKQEIIFETGDKVKCLKKIPCRVKLMASTKKGFFSDLPRDERYRAEVVAGWKVPTGTVGEVLTKQSDGTYAVRFDLEEEDRPYYITVTCQVEGDILEFVPPEEEPVSSIEGDTFTTHGKGTGK